MRKLDLKKNKKAQMKEIQAFIIYLVLAAVVLVIVIFFIREVGTKTQIEEQILAKQISLLIDSSLPNTKIIIYKSEKLEASLNENTITVKIKQLTKGFQYDFFSRNSVELEDNGDRVIIQIGDKK